MDNFTISEYFTLPSQGLVYDKKVVPTVHLSSMTTRHEMQRLAPSPSQYKPMCDVIDDCLIDDIGISSYDMCSGDYQFLMFKLRIVTYGKDITIMDTCPHCGDKSELKIDLNNLQNISNIDDFKKYSSFTLPRSGKKIVLNYQTPRMLDNIVEGVREYSERVKTNKVDQTLVFLLKELIKTVDGHTPDPLNFEEWVRNLPMMDTNTITAYAEKMDRTIGVNTELEIKCDMCGQTHKAQFRPGPEFFRPKMDF